MNSNMYAQVAKRYDIVIDELMVDPAPQIGLPNNEWVELKNISTVAFNLAGWRVGDAAGQSGAMPSYILKPDSFVIVCSSGSVAAMNAFGPTISVTSFPSLDNDADIIFLRSPQNIIIHAVGYNSAWYNNELKKDGGWTLEMTDTKNPCSAAANWVASINSMGGTPGKINSVDAHNPDQFPPKLLSAYAADSLNIVLVFDEPLDSLRSTAPNNYLVSDGIGIPQNVVAGAPVFDRIYLKLNMPLTRNKIYTVTVNAVTDCAGNAISNNSITRVGLSAVAENMDVVINEILFNPKPNGTDYLELYNRSNKIIDLQQLYIANRNSSAVISSIKQLSIGSRLLFPQDFLLITENPLPVQSQYFCPNPGSFITLNGMPSFNDDKGDAIILNAQGNIVDELQYDEKWHFKLIDNDEGVSLERIDYNALTQDPLNWHSAATSSGYGTPGYKNSQYRADAQLQGTITVSPEIISPDNDGMDDFATLDYNFPEPGYVASITIFDAAGRSVRYLQQNALCGIKGNFRWDGLGEKNQQLPVGIYIFYTEVFNLKGKSGRFKNVVVLARKV
ncbi:MAG: lamin tail domain-containing protein [Ferruginibacter sp.]